MLISKTKKFIFIHIPKNAGQSISSTLLKYCVSDNTKFVINLIGPRNYLRINTKLEKYLNFTLYEHNFKDHERAYMVLDTLKDDYANYFKFAFVRNPWDRLFSRYNYALKNVRHYNHKFIKRNFSSFNEYVEWDCLKNPNKKYQKEFILNHHGEKIVDFIGKFENLENDFKKVCESIGVNEKIPHFNQSVKSDYRKHYSMSSRDLVRDCYSTDIELLNYEF